MTTLPIENYVNQILTANCAQALAILPDASVDLVVTSPPYDSLREYKGFSFDFPSIAAHLYRVLKPGGVVVWVVNDSVKNGSETGTSFRQALGFMDAGFCLNDTMIYAKSNPTPTNGLGQHRFAQAFEFMFVFSKGMPRVFNPLVRPRRNKHNDGRKFRIKTFNRTKNGEFAKERLFTFNEYVLLENFWFYVVGGGNSTEDKGITHPAIFPEQLALEHILAWTNPGDIVLDPMSGSGTVLKMAKLTGRRYVGIEISPDYARQAAERLAGVEFNAIELPTVEYQGQKAILIQVDG